MAPFLAGAAAHGEEVLAGLSALATRAAALPTSAAALLALAGAALLLAGARSRRVIGAVGGAAVGALAALAARGAIEGLGLAPGTAVLAAGGAALLGLLGWRAPRLFVLAAGALPGALLGAALPVAERPWLGVVAGAAALGALALLAAELTAVTVASVLGAGLLGGAALAAAGPGTELAARPFLLLGWLAVIGAAGGAVQLGRAWGKKGRAGGAPPPALSPPYPPADRAARSPGSRA